MDASHSFKSEKERLEALNSYHIIDNEPEADYDSINMLVAMICDVPISLIQILREDRFYFKSKLGVDMDYFDRKLSFCNVTVKRGKYLEIKDARLDDRFKDNPVVTKYKAVFYAGIPLINKDGFTMGTICIYDYKPKELNEDQREALRILSNQVVNLFELRKTNYLHEKYERELSNRNEHLKDFASHVSHDLKSPLANITSLTQMLKEDDLNSFSEESELYLDYIQESTTVLKDYVDGILLHYKSDELLNTNNEDILLDDLAEDIKLILMTGKEKLIYPQNTEIKNINRAALSQILINLIDNALKYNDKKKPIIEIDYFSDLFFHKFSVSDNGVGIPKDKQEIIFKIFKTLKN
ncbi:MAG: GAF domain-containing sensor histidine kinase, partial [Bacteroidota bacterium]